MACRANSTDDGRQTVHLRSYKTTAQMPEEFPDFKIWEAARATSVAPAYFQRLKVGQDEFIDGGMGWNNPILELITEVSLMYGVNRPVGCILSLGTGVPLDLKFGSGYAPVEDVIKMLTNSERAHENAMPFSKYIPLPGLDKYWRLNLSKALSDKDTVMKIVMEKPWFGKPKEKEVPVGYGDVMTVIDDWTAIPLIRKLTDKWLEHQSEQEGLKKCASRLSQKTK
ncbi:hypothetical protein M422DRAFT_179754 [Sphaerobolus stellatus SS14]|uniref:PNPLA domain-containing protein n=1 Tax=Sphaerobolus stellatus (strain SS14) TaxID=990650 RepID=A0A0C9VFC3_SPHS4|nr:hypothetical protein M422DRAFT_179754 [Sphaerobolus stellatus SS14]